MKRKSRFRKKASIKGRLERYSKLISSPEAEEEPGEPEEELEEVKPPAASAPQTESTIEILFGFGLLGVTVGFLSGYGNMNLFEGIMQGVAGLVIGVGLGYIPCMTRK